MPQHPASDVSPLPTRAIDALSPLPNIWYENDKGEKYTPTQEELKEPYDVQGKSKDYPIQHYLGPQVTEEINGPDGQLGAFNTTINCIEPVVLYLCLQRQWTLPDAVTAVSQTCERCLNILLEEVTGEPYKERGTAHTHCDQCAIVDPEYHKSYGIKTDDSERDRSDSGLTAKALYTELVRRGMQKQITEIFIKRCAKIIADFYIRAEDLSYEEMEQFRKDAGKIRNAVAVEIAKYLRQLPKEQLDQENQRIYQLVQNFAQQALTGASLPEETKKMIENLSGTYGELSDRIVNVLLNEPDISDATKKKIFSTLNKYFLRRAESNLPTPEEVYINYIKSVWHTLTGRTTTPDAAKVMKHIEDLLHTGKEEDRDKAILELSEIREMPEEVKAHFATAPIDIQKHLAAAIASFLRRAFGEYGKEDNFDAGESLGWEEGLDRFPPTSTTKIDVEPDLLQVDFDGSSKSKKDPKSRDYDDKRKPMDGEAGYDGASSSREEITDHGTGLVDILDNTTRWPGGTVYSSQWVDRVPGGLADKKAPSDFEPLALEKGIKVEMGHTSDPKIATEIAMDHLTEDPQYYEKLEKMEKGSALKGFFKVVAKRLGVQWFSEYVRKALDESETEEDWAKRGEEAEKFREQERKLKEEEEKEIEKAFGPGRKLPKPPKVHETTLEKTEPLTLSEDRENKKVAPKKSTELATQLAPRINAFLQQKEKLEAAREALAGKPDLSREESSQLDYLNRELNYVENQLNLWQSALKNEGEKKAPEEALPEVPLEEDTDIPNTESAGWFEKGHKFFYAPEEEEARKKKPAALYSPKEQDEFILFMEQNPFLNFILNKAPFSRVMHFLPGKEPAPKYSDVVTYSYTVDLIPEMPEPPLFTFEVDLPFKHTQFAGTEAKFKIIPPKNLESFFISALQIAIEDRKKNLALLDVKEFREDKNFDLWQKAVQTDFKDKLSKMLDTLSETIKFMATEYTPSKKKKETPERTSPAMSEERPDAIARFTDEIFTRLQIEMSRLFHVTKEDAKQKYLAALPTSRKASLYIQAEEETDAESEIVTETLGSVWDKNPAGILSEHFKDAKQIHQILTEDVDTGGQVIAVIDKYIGDASAQIHAIGRLIRLPKEALGFYTGDIYRIFKQGDDIIGRVVFRSEYPVKSKEVAANHIERGIDTTLASETESIANDLYEEISTLQEKPQKEISPSEKQQILMLEKQLLAISPDKARRLKYTPTGEAIDVGEAEGEESEESQKSVPGEIVALIKENHTYKIVSQETVDFTDYGAKSNEVGVVFKATKTETLGSGDKVEEISLAVTPEEENYELVQRMKNFLKVKKLSEAMKEQPEAEFKVTITNIQNDVGECVAYIKDRVAMWKALNNDLARITALSTLPEGEAFIVNDTHVAKLLSLLEKLSLSFSGDVTGVKKIWNEYSELRRERVAILDTLSEEPEKEKILHKKLDINGNKIQALREDISEAVTDVQELVDTKLISPLRAKLANKTTYKSFAQIPWTVDSMNIEPKKSAKKGQLYESRTKEQVAAFTDMQKQQEELFSSLKDTTSLGNLTAAVEQLLPKLSQAPEVIQRYLLFLMQEKTEGGDPRLVAEIVAYKMDAFYSILNGLTELNNAASVVSPKAKEASLIVRTAASDFLDTIIAAMKKIAQRKSADPTVDINSMKEFWPQIDREIIHYTSMLDPMLQEFASIADGIKDKMKSARLDLSASEEVTQRVTAYRSRLEDSGLSEEEFTDKVDQFQEDLFLKKLGEVYLEELKDAPEKVQELIYAASSMDTVLRQVIALLQLYGLPISLVKKASENFPALKKAVSNENIKKVDQQLRDAAENLPFRALQLQDLLKENTMMKIIANLPEPNKEELSQVDVANFERILDKDVTFSALNKAISEFVKANKELVPELVGYQKTIAENIGEQEKAKAAAVAKGENAFRQTAPYDAAINELRDIDLKIGAVVKKTASLMALLSGITTVQKTLREIKSDGDLITLTDSIRKWEFSDAAIPEIKNISVEEIDAAIKATIQIFEQAVAELEQAEDLLPGKLKKIVRHRKVTKKSSFIYQQPVDLLDIEKFIIRNYLEKDIEIFACQYKAYDLPMDLFDKALEYKYGE